MGPQDRPEPADVGEQMADQVNHDPGRQANGRRIRLLRTVGRPERVGPVVQRNLGVWLALALIAVIVGLDLVGGGNAELLGLLVGPPILAASFVGPKRTVAVGWSRLAPRSATAGRSGWTCWPAPRGAGGRDRGRDGAVGVGGSGPGGAGGAAAGGHPGR
jgi:hypothetical protein